MGLARGVWLWHDGAMHTSTARRNRRRSGAALGVALVGLLGCAAPEPAGSEPTAQAPLWPLPLARSDVEVDAWLQRASATYARMLREIRARPEVVDLRWVETAEVADAAVASREGVLEVQLSPGLKGARRISLIAFELANAYRNREHQAIDRAVDSGLITSAAEFGLAHELYEYEALRLHRQILIELEERTGSLPAEMFMIRPAPPSARESQLPDLLHYLKTQRDTGHTDHYRRWFERRAGPR